MKPIDQMSIVALCEAIKAEGERLGVKVEILQPGATVTRDSMVLRERHDRYIDVFLSWRLLPMVYGKYDLLAGLRRWMSLRGEV